MDIFRDIETHIRNTYGHQGPPRVNATGKVLSTTDESVVSYFDLPSGEGFTVGDQSWYLPSDLPLWVEDLLDPETCWSGYNHLLAQWLSWGGGIHQVQPHPVVEFQTFHPYWDTCRKQLRGTYLHQPGMGSAPDLSASAKLLSDAMTCIHRLDLPTEQIIVSQKGFGILQTVAPRYLNETPMGFNIWGFDVLVDEHIEPDALEINSVHHLRTLTLPWTLN